MIIRDGRVGDALTSRVKTRTEMASYLTTPYIHFSGGQKDANAKPNYGNIGASTFAWADSANYAVMMANAPWVVGELSGDFRHTCFWFSGEATDTDLLKMCDPWLNNGAFLFFGRIKLTNNGYDEHILSLGKGDDLGILDSAGHLKYNFAAGTLSFFWRNVDGGGGTVDKTVMAAGGVPAGGVEHRILMLFDWKNAEIKTLVNEANITLVDISTEKTAYSVTNSLTSIGIGVTFGNGGIGLTPGSRDNDPNNYLAGDYRDFAMFDVSANVDTVSANMQAIANAFGSAPEGYIPVSLKDLIE